jgi:hypothetical protein
MTKDKGGLLAIPSDGDLLFGAAAITDFVNTLSATKINRRQIYYWLESGHVPSGKIGTKIVGSRRALREHFTRITGGG